MRREVDADQREGNGECERQEVADGAPDHHVNSVLLGCRSFKSTSSHSFL